MSLKLLAAHTGDIGGVDDGDGLAVLVLLVVLLCVDLFVLFKILGPLERLFADLIAVRAVGQWTADGNTSHEWGLRGV